MPTYKTPGVYVEEIATLPPSVAEVSTAVPAFIGLTKKIPAGKTLVPIRIDSLMEYEDLFGNADNKPYKLDVTKDMASNTISIQDVSSTGSSVYNLYYALRLFYDNGGGACWIVALGSEGSIANYNKALKALDAVDEPTLLLAPHAAIDLNSVDFHALCQSMLKSASDLKDRFVIMDIPSNDTAVEKFRSTLSDNLSYGAAYTPFLNTAISYLYDEKTSVTVKVNLSNATQVTQPVVLEGLDAKEITANIAALTEFVTGADKELTIAKNLNYDPSQNDNLATLSPSTGTPSIDFKLEGTVKSYVKSTGVIVINITKNEGSVSNQTTNKKFKISVAPKNSTATSTPSGSSTYESLESLASKQTDVYHAVKSYLKGMPTVVAPPSSSIAGVYARVDRQRGVWKAPANVGVSNVIGPVRNIDNNEQDNLNVDPTGGKSINVIRSFSGRGTLVWGARTLAGNDNEWRYVPVRRLFITIEESIQKATAFAVFEPNDVSTWLKVKAMIESYLYGLWQQGALAGSSPEAAYFVNVGLGKTMNANDVLNGLMKVEVGIAAVRPAEFIILKFSHKLQTS